MENQISKNNIKGFVKTKFVLGYAKPFYKKGLL